MIRETEVKTCRHTKSSVINSRPYGKIKGKKEDFEYSIYRRRRCLNCHEKFNTFEMSNEQIDDAVGDIRHSYESLVAKLKKLVGEI